MVEKEKQVMGHSVRQAYIYVYALGKLTQCETKVYREKQIGRNNESIRVSFMAGMRSWVEKWFGQLYIRENWDECTTSLYSFLLL